MSNDTFFPSLDGTSPGDNKEVVQSLVDNPILEPLFPQSDVATAPSQIEGIDAPAATPDTAEATPIEPAEPPRRKTVQDRIDRLTKRNHESRNENTLLSQQLAALSQQNQMLFNQLMQSRAAPVAPAQSSDPFASASAGAVAAPSVDIRKEIAEAVRGEVAPITESLSSLHRGNAIRQAHENSFVEAAEDYPELRDSKSEFRKVFNDLYDGSPEQVKALPNAPMHFALQARGILADAKRSEQTRTANKRAATVHIPTPTATDQPTEGIVPQNIEKAAAAAKQRLRDGISTHEDYALLRRLSQFKQQRGQ